MDRAARRQERRETAVKGMETQAQQVNTQPGPRFSNATSGFKGSEKLMLNLLVTFTKQFMSVQVQSVYIKQPNVLIMVFYVISEGK